MEKHNRAVRRHHVDRLKKNRKNYWGYGYGRTGNLSERQLGIIVTTPEVCACWMCNRPRKAFGRPLKEVAFDAFTKAVDGYDEDND